MLIQVKFPFNTILSPVLLVVNIVAHLEYVCAYFFLAFISTYMYIKKMPTIAMCALTWMVSCITSATRFSPNHSTWVTFKSVYMALCLRTFHRINVLVTIVRIVSPTVTSSVAVSSLAHVQVFLHELLGHRDAHFNYNSYCQIAHQYSHAKKKKSRSILCGWVGEKKKSDCWYFICLNVSL